MKQRIKGLVSLWLAVILLLGNFASASGVLDEYIRYYTGEDELALGDYIYDYEGKYDELTNISYGAGADTLAAQLDSYLDSVPDGMKHAGWEFWMMNDCGAIIAGPVRKDADIVLDEGVVSSLSYSMRLLIAPILEAKTYTVRWVNHDGSELEADDAVPHGETPHYDGAVPEKSADAEYTYTFEGWSPAISEVTEDITYTARFVPTASVRHTVKFETNGGSEISDATVADGETLAKPSDPTRAGYTFKGWYKDSELSNEYDFALAVNENFTLYAKWEAKTYTVRWVNYDGSELEVDENVPYNSVPDYSGGLPEKPADGDETYTFDGWAPGLDNVTEDITYTARFVPTASVRHTVKFETNGGSEISDVTVTDGEILAKPSDPTRAGHTFKGWYQDSELSNEYDFTLAVNESFTLYAKWEKIPQSYGGGGGGGVVSAPTTVKDYLNTEEHFAYVSGYRDKTVRPEQNITRAETTEIFFRLLNAETRAKYRTDTHPFTDVSDSAWYRTSAATMANAGIIKGRTPTDFVADAFITRAEFAAICARFDSSDYKVTHTFTDIAGHWAEAEIYEAAAHGWIRGYSDGSFRPNEFITRAEAITLINRMLERTPNSKHDLHPDMVTWVDNPEDAWYYLAVQEATNDHEYTKTSDGTETWSDVN